MDDALRFNERLCLMECNVNRRFGEERNSERVKGGYLTASSGENVYASALEQAEDYICDNAELLAALDIREVALSMLKPLGMGEHNKNFWFAHPTTGEKFVLRVNVASQPFHDDQVAYEFVALEALAKSGRVPRPVYLDNSSAALGKGVLVESFCEGDMLDFDHLRPGDLRCAAQIMADVHAVAVSRDCPLHRPSDPLRGLMEECVERFDVYRRSAFEDSRITSWTRRFLEASQRALDTAPPPRDREHIVNTETLPSHFLIPAASALQAAANDAPSGVFCANPGYFVDWERPIVGEVAQDVAYFVSPTTTFWDSEFLFPTSGIDSFVEDYWRAVDGRFERNGFDERFQPWLMMTALRSTTWCCRALVTYNDPSVHKTEKTARKLPVYLSDEFMEMLADEVFHL